MENLHPDGEPWTFECPECGICKRTKRSMYGHRRDQHGLLEAEQGKKLAMRLTDEQIRVFKDALDGGEPFARQDLLVKDACHCTADPGSLASLPCNPPLQELLGYDASDLRIHPDVTHFYRTLSAAGKDTKYVYLLFRAKPNARLSEEELARAVFYVGQTSEPLDRIKFYDQLLRDPREQLNKGKERFRYEYEFATRNNESVIMLKVRVVVGGKTLQLFHPAVLESSIMLLLGMERLGNVQLSLINTACSLSDEVKAVLVHARLAAAAAFKATARVVDVDVGDEWDPTAWVDVSKELRKRQALYTEPSVNHAAAVSSNYSSTAELQSTSVSNAATSDVCSDATFNSSSGQASSSSDVFSSLFAKQVPGDLVVHGVQCHLYSSSGQPSAIAAKRCAISDSTEGSERGASVSSGNTSTICAPPVKKLRLIKEPDCSASTLQTPDSIEGGAVTKHVKSFGTLLQTLDCSVEDVIRHWSPLVSKYFVASDGVTASHLPKFSPPVQPSDSSESVELWPLPHGSIGTFAQSQRRNG